MKKRVQTCVSVALLLIFLFQYAGYIVLFQFRQTAAKERFQSLLKGSCVQKHEDFLWLNIPVNITEGNSDFLIWENETEFHYKGHLYDIAHKEVSGDSIRYRCRQDKEEESLFACLGLDENIYAQSPSSPREMPLKEYPRLFLQEFLLAQAPELAPLGSEAYIFKRQGRLYEGIVPGTLNPPPEV